jgi:septal ring-binding cell division protein DamX
VGIVVVTTVCVTLSGGRDGSPRGTATVQAQSLGDLARKEEDRRKTVAPGKVYTNDSLPRTAAPPAVAAAPAPSAPDAASSAPGQARKPGPADPATQSPVAGIKKDEAYWRGRLQAERDGLERAKVLLAALQSRANALQADFVNRDDPAQRSVLFSERQRALAELDRTGLEIEQRTKAAADLQEEARRAGVPAAWYR